MSSDDRHPLHVRIERKLCNHCPSGSRTFSQAWSAPPKSTGEYFDGYFGRRTACHPSSILLVVGSSLFQRRQVCQRRNVEVLFELWKDRGCAVHLNSP